MKKYIIILIHEQQGKAYILHTDKRFHEHVCDSRGCHVVEYQSLTAAKRKAKECCKRYTYGKSYAMTYGELEHMEDLTRGFYKASQRTDIMTEYATSL